MKVENLESKFINYSLLSGAFLLLNQRSEAQVVYTDVNPDTIFDAAGEGAYFDIDINGTYDYAVVNNSFTFYHVYFSSTWSRQDILAGPFLSTNSIAGKSINYSTDYGGFLWYFPFALNSNSIISDKLEWHNSGIQILAIRDYFNSGENTRPCFYCEWYGPDLPDIIDHYIGIKFIGNDEEMHFGWIRCDVKDEGRTLIVKDYAYEMQPNYPIVAGDTVSYVEINNYENTLDAVVYNFDKKLYVQTSLYTNTFLSIYDATGRIVFKSQLGSNSEIIDIAQFPDGIYIVTLRQNEKVYSRKISF